MSPSSPRARRRAAPGAEDWRCRPPTLRRARDRIAHRTVRLRRVKPQTALVAAGSPRRSPRSKRFGSDRGSSNAVASLERPAAIRACVRPTPTCGISSVVGGRLHAHRADPPPENMSRAAASARGARLLTGRRCGALSPAGSTRSFGPYACVVERAAITLVLHQTASLNACGSSPPAPRDRSPAAVAERRERVSRPELRLGNVAWTSASASGSARRPSAWTPSPRSPSIPCCGSRSASASR